jgi:hypothetical protein
MFKTVLFRSLILLAITALFTGLLFVFFNSQGSLLGLPGGEGEFRQRPQFNQTTSQDGAASLTQQNFPASPEGGFREGGDHNQADLGRGLGGVFKNLIIISIVTVLVVLFGTLRVKLFRKAPVKI